jgi:tRNA modification GTPase
LLATCPAGRTVLVLNKCDLGQAYVAAQPPAGVAGPVHVSALTGAGVELLQRQVYATALEGLAAPREEGALMTARQKHAAERALEGVRRALEGYRAGAPEDLLSVDLQAAVRALGEITGQDATEDLLDTIFSRFCIGK